MAGYCRKFCWNFSIVTAPLTNLLRKQEPFIWTSACQEAFDPVKPILLSSPVLIEPDFDKQFKLYVDASNVGAGAVLQQEDDQGIDHLISYFSRKFEGTQRRYSTIEKETLALLLALKHFDVYLVMTAEPVLVYTDHNIIVFMHPVNKMKEKNQRLLRWRLILQLYSILISHIKRRENAIADTLSRIKWWEPLQLTLTLLYCCFVLLTDFWLRYCNYFNPACIMVRGQIKGYRQCYKLFVTQLTTQLCSN